MADSKVTVNTAGGGTAAVDTFTQADGDNRQAVVLGDAAGAQTATVDAAGHLLTHGPTSGLGAVNAVALTASTAAVLMPELATRLFGSVYNPLTSDLFVSLAVTASATSYTVIVPPLGYFELPASYTGPVAGFSTAAGNALVTVVS